jgi:cation diffusion facilitator family transporter
VKYLIISGIPWSTRIFSRASKKPVILNKQSPKHRYRRDHLSFASLPPGQGFPGFRDPLSLITNPIKGYRLHHGIVTLTSGSPVHRTVEDELNSRKKKTARLSVASNTLLVVLKLVVGIAIGSISIISEAIHSGIDLMAAIIAYFSVKKSSEPPDDIHEFGHGKFEDISGLAEATLIFVAAALIIYEAVNKLIHGEDTFDLNLIGIGIAVMMISVIVNWYVSSRLMQVAKESESIALESDAWHLRTDVFTSLGVFAGLVAIRVTGLTILDPIFAFGVALIIIKTAYDLTRKSLADLIDTRLPDKEEERIRRIICEHCTDYSNFHDLRTRRSGPERFIDLHLVVPKDLSVQQAHDIADHLESDLKFEFPRVSVTIHVEPCDEACAECETICTIQNRKEPLT